MADLYSNYIHDTGRDLAHYRTKGSRNGISRTPGYRAIGDIAKGPTELSNGPKYPVKGKGSQSKYGSDVKSPTHSLGLANRATGSKPMSDSVHGSSKSASEFANPKEKRGSDGDVSSFRSGGVQNRGLRRTHQNADTVVSKHPGKPGTTNSIANIHARVELNNLRTRHPRAYDQEIARGRRRTEADIAVRNEEKEREINRQRLHRQILRDQTKPGNHRPIREQINDNAERNRQRAEATENDINARNADKEERANKPEEEYVQVEQNTNERVKPGTRTAEEILDQYGLGSHNRREQEALASLGLTRSRRQQAVLDSMGIDTSNATRGQSSSGNTRKPRKEANPSQRTGGRKETSIRRDVPGASGRSTVIREEGSERSHARRTNAINNLVNDVGSVRRVDTRDEVTREPGEKSTSRERRKKKKKNRSGGDVK